MVVSCLPAVVVAGFGFVDPILLFPLRRRVLTAVLEGGDPDAIGLIPTSLSLITPCLCLTLTLNPSSP